MESARAFPFALLHPVDLEAIGSIVADRTLADGRHVVLDDANVRHRLWLCTAQTDRPTAFIVPADHNAPMRLDATQRFEHRLRELTTRPARPAFRPTRFQRRRLTQLLRLAEAARMGASIRDMAMHIVFPHMAALPGAAWKASSERRHTQRLLGEAVALTRGGYRTLLQA